MAHAVSGRTDQKRFGAVDRVAGSDALIGRIGKVVDKLGYRRRVGTRDRRPRREREYRSRNENPFQFFAIVSETRFSVV
jgi:hypothetical protein